LIARQSDQIAMETIWSIARQFDQTIWSITRQSDQNL